jgi:hypothetical protein
MLSEAHGICFYINLLLFSVEMDRWELLYTISISLLLFQDNAVYLKEG